MTDSSEQFPMSFVLAWHPYSRSNDLIEAFGEFSKELEVVARSRGGIAAVDLFTGRGIADNTPIAKTILQSIVFSVTDIYELCLEQAEKIEKICQVEEYDMIANVKGLDKGERVALHFGPVPELFDTLAEYLVCSVLRRTVEMWMAVQYVKEAGRLCDGDMIDGVSDKKKETFLTYIATELSEDPFIIDDDLLDWIRDSSEPLIQDLKTQLDAFKAMKVHRMCDFLDMIKWKQYFIALYSEILVISEVIYTSYGSSSRWDDAPLILPLIMMGAGALSNNRTLIDIFNRVLPENSPKMRAHKRLLNKLFPA